MYVIIETDKEIIIIIYFKNEQDSEKNEYLAYNIYFYFKYLLWSSFCKIEQVIYRCKETKHSVMKYE